MSVYLLSWPSKLPVLFTKLHDQDGLASVILPGHEWHFTAPLSVHMLFSILTDHFGAKSNYSHSSLDLFHDPFCVWYTAYSVNRWPGGGWSYIFWTLNSIPFFPDKSRYHRIFTLSGLFRTCQAPDPAAEVDPIAHFGHFRSHLATCTWQQINSKIVAIDQCHSVIASISELLSILVCFIYQIIPLQSLL